MSLKNKFPHFIPDKPTGDDVFEGQSQAHLACRICEHIKYIDTETNKEILLPRIIGIEGTWGSGKSNIVTKVDTILSKENYYMFTYDAWGHQEDLQRRSILETLTNDLINHSILNGNVSIQMRNGLENKDTWKKQFSLLLSNKKITTKKSFPSLSWSGICAASLAIIVPICCSISEQLTSTSYDYTNYWLINFTPIIIVLSLFIYYLYNKNIKGLTRLVDSNAKETIDEEYTSSEEPSVMEFKNWIGAISKYIGTTKQKKNKIIIVFDNMDRLPSEKVMQLWSAIYTFFAGSEFENIWTIIPYDYRHLCEAITGKAFKYENKLDDDNCIKRFINKTFPIVYTVPQPVITDYRKLFNDFFESAFDKTEHDQEHICLVFIKLKRNPNPRTVISFINELVSLRLQWSDKKYRLQNLALYILKKDQLLYNENSLDQNLLGDDIFDSISALYPDKEKVRTQLCQFAYGLEDETLAGELPLRKVLQQAIKTGESIAEYAEHIHFIRILEDVLTNDVDKTSLDTAIKSLVSLDQCELSDDVAKLISKKWDMLANLKSTSLYQELVFDDALARLIPHASERRVLDMTKAFCKTMQKCKIAKGELYFNALDSIKVALKNANKDDNINKYLNNELTTPDIFTEYVICAKEQYQYYKLRADNSALNDYILELIKSDNEESATIMSYIYKDNSYDFTSLKNSLAELVRISTANDNIRIAAYINRLLNDTISDRFSVSAINANIQRFNVSPNKIMDLGNEDIYIMYLANNNDIANFHHEMIPRMADCFNKYFNYSTLIKRLGTPNSALNRLNIYIINNGVVYDVDLKYVAQNIIDIKTKLNLDYKVVLSYFNKYGKIKWDENDINSYTTYFKQELCEEYKNTSGDFTDSVISLSVNALQKQTEGFLVDLPNIQINTYWSKFIMTYLGTSFIPKMDIHITKEFTLLLDMFCNGHIDIHNELLEKLLKSEPNIPTLKAYLHDKLNIYFQEKNISNDIFKIFGNLLPMLGYSMDDNTARGLISHLIKPIYTIPECADIIVKHKDFYINILSHDLILSQDIINDMKTLENVKNIYSAINKELLQLTIVDDTENTI